MKRWAKAWLAVGVGCCVCGAALTGIGVASGGSKYVKSADLNKMDGAAKKSDNEMVLEKTKLDDFDSADISMTDMNLQVVNSDDQYCYISYRASDQKKDPISYQVKDGKLRIQENNNDGKTYYHVDIGFLSGLLGEGTLTTDENVVTIYVPEGTQSTVLRSVLKLAWDQHVSTQSFSLHSSNLQESFRKIRQSTL